MGVTNEKITVYLFTTVKIKNLIQKKTGHCACEAASSTVLPGSQMN
jgi:hypothetical protein